MFVGCKNRLTGIMLIYTAFGHKDGIVISLTKDERGKDDIHDIELDAEYSHKTENPHPTDSHRHEGYYSQFYLTEREPQEEEHDKRTCPADIVKVVRQAICQRTVKTLNIETARDAALHFLYL